VNIADQAEAERLEALDALIGRNQEAVHCRARSSVDRHPDAYRTIGVIGGGTAGYFTALCLRAEFPHLDITLVESSQLGVIGVGESTITEIVTFLHKYLKLDIHEFYEKVKPTWKQGIRFEWGKPGDYYFNGPFDWDENNIGALGSLSEQGHTRAMSLQSILMDRDRAPLLRNGEKYVSLLHRSSFAAAYHLDNRRLVAYLHEVAVRAGIKYLDRIIKDAVLVPDGSEVSHLVTSEGEKLSYDLYIDCTGFRSMLLGQKLGSPFMSYGASLFTDRALVFETPHGGHIKSFTTAKSMESGWTWIIPQVEDDHCGYVYASAFCSEAEAEREVRSKFPDAGDVHVVRFRSGRHEEAWKGNVFSVGNSYGFVEPLESTGIMMICRTVRALCEVFPASKKDESAKRLLNINLAKVWDGLRWFLSAHYKFNNKYDTPFWRAARAETDVSGLQPLLDAFRDLAPLHFRNKAAKELLGRSVEVVFFGVEALDCILLGQGVPARTYERSQDTADWRRRRELGLWLAEHCVPVREALDAVRTQPELLDDLLENPASWVNDGVRVTLNQ
jgi:tryptophan halogenase